MKTYIAINKQTWEKITVMLAGAVFSREKDGIYYLKMPLKYANQLISTGVIKEYNENEKNN